MDAKELGDERVFPVSEKDTDNWGLTIREYFAAKAMQGLLTIYDNNEQNPTVPNESNIRYMARLSVTAADALLAELSKTEQP